MTSRICAAAFLLFVCTSLFAQEVDVTGQVTDPCAAVPDVKVTITNTLQLQRQLRLSGDDHHAGEAAIARAHAADILYLVEEHSGHLGRNTETTPDVSDLDLILSKIFTFTERIRLQMRFEVFNSTNTPPFTTAPNATVATNGFGQTTAASAPRELQFALKPLW